jgi:hypothetical protein
VFSDGGEGEEYTYNKSYGVGPSAIVETVNEPESRILFFESRVFGHEEIWEGT